MYGAMMCHAGLLQCGRMHGQNLKVDFPGNIQRTPKFLDVFNLKPGKVWIPCDLEVPKNFPSTKSGDQDETTARSSAKPPWLAQIQGEVAKEDDGDDN